MKDNFDIRQYLTENKLTEATRESRVHFGKTVLNDNVILEGLYDVDPNRDGFEAWCQDQGIDPNSEEGRMARADYDAETASMQECDLTADAPIEEANIDRDALYKEFLGYANKYGEEKAWKIMAKFHPEVDFNKVNIVPQFARKNAELNAKQDQKRLNNVTTFDQHERSSDEPVYDKQGYRVGNTVIDEVGYTDDEDDDFADDDYIGARGSNAELGITNDKRAAAAAKASMAGTDLDTDAPDDAPEFPDQPDDAADDNADFQDPEDIDTQASAPSAANTDVDPAKIFGENAPYVEVLVDDLGQYLRGPKGRWRVNVSSKLLSRAVDLVRAYMKEYEYPRKGFLLAPNKAGNYDEIPVLGMNTVNNTPKAVVYVHREPINEQ